ncbi:MAG: NAD-dependent deacylase [Anaerolineae bacterium]|nr:NAD-dependent deacylase [Anaerolineae bacterium]MDW8172066.1 NAD-dependent deacylase [Anaerolineae bacterium]
MDDYALKAALVILRAAQRIAILSGAGASKESGVPTFRDAMDGLWAKYDPTQLATPQAFRANPRLVWEWYAYRRDLVRQARPNPGHYALAQLQHLRPQTVLVTQNVDELHEQAGSHQVIHLHGRIFQTKCFADCRGSPTLVDEDALPPTEVVPPPCPHCGAPLRPNVVWFNEALPIEALQRAYDAFATCDLALVVGTSGLVHPAAGLPYLAKQRGVPLIEVNPHESAITHQSDIWLDAPAGEVLPRLLEGLRA